MKNKIILISLGFAALTLASCSGSNDGGNELIPDQQSDKGPQQDEIDAKRNGSTEFVFEPIGGKDITKECDEKGTIEKVTYTTHAYALEAEDNVNNYVVEKQMNVYLPYGYSVENKYNVLILAHGSGENEDFWFAQGDYDPNNITTYLRGYGTTNVLDNMIKSGKAEKTIVVTPCLYTTYNGKDSPNSNFHDEVNNDILPYIVDHYSTFAENSTSAGIIAARDHFAYAGLSMGSGIGFRSIWTNSFEYISYIGNYSGGVGEEVYTEIANNLTTGKYKDYECNYWFNGCGNIDGLATEHASAYLGLLSKTGNKFKVGYDVSQYNADFVYIKGTGHSYACWLTCLYNSMLVFFK